nr:MAG TPA: hypothetical protein [Caudoviricetes sp.]
MESLLQHSLKALITLPLLGKRIKYFPDILNWSIIDKDTA